MRKLILKNYMVPAVLPDGTRTEHEYDVRGMIDMIVLASTEQQRLGRHDLMKRARVTQKIVECKEDFILLEEEDFKLIDQGFEAFKGFGRNEVELNRRVLECEEIEVIEKKPEKEKGK